MFNSKDLFTKLKDIRGATKLYFTRYSCAVIILFNTGL